MTLKDDLHSNWHQTVDSNSDYEHEQFERNQFVNVKEIQWSNTSKSCFPLTLRSLTKFKAIEKV